MRIDSLTSAASVYADKSAKSRTYVDGVKAVRIANNTTLRKIGETYVIRFHATDIVTFSEGHATLRSGGYASMTTAQRLHQYTPQSVRVNAKDVLSKRADADPHLIVSVNGDHYGYLTSEHSEVKVPTA